MGTRYWLREEEGREAYSAKGKLKERPETSCNKRETTKTCLKFIKAPGDAEQKL